jgi:hypothetical protein
MSVFKDLYVRQDLNVDGVAVVTGDLTVNGTTTTVASNLNVGGNTLITGDLTVNGTTTSINTTDVNVEDNFMYLNNGYTTVANLPGGIVVNFTATGTGAGHSDTTAAGGFTSTTEISTTSADNLSANDIIQISGATNTNNNGIFIVASHIANVLTIKTSSNYAQTEFVASADAGVVIQKVKVSILQANATGWEIASGSDDTLVFNPITTSVGGGLSGDTLSLTAETNQLFLGDTGVITVSAPGTADATITFPDTAGVGGEVVLTTGTQSIVGAKVFTEALSTLSTDLVLSSETTFHPTLRNTTFAASRIYSVVDVGSDANVVLADAGTDGAIYGWDASNKLTLAKGLTTSIVTQLQAITTETISSTQWAYLGASDQGITTTSSMLFASTTLDPNSAAGGAIIVTNTTPQTSGNLVSIAGTTAFTALNVSAGDVVVAENLTTGTLSSATLSLTADTAQIVLDSDGTAITITTAAQAGIRTFTIPATAGSDSFVMTTGVQTLTDKELTAPVISTIVNTGTLTLPTSTDTLVGRDTTDTLTNKTLTNPVFTVADVTGAVTISADISDCATGTYTVTLPALASSIGKKYIIHFKGNGAITVASNASEILGGDNTDIVLDTQFQSLSLIGTADNWVIA